MGNNIKSILIFGGTTEGRIITESIANRPDLQGIVCVATSYGEDILDKNLNGIKIHQGRMDEKEIEDFIALNNFDLCIDATHPYAQIVSENIKLACKNKELSLVRVTRDINEVPADVDAEIFESIDEGVDFLKNTEGNILITTGSKDLKKYTSIPDFEKRCFVRVLPSEESISLCKENGFLLSHVLALHGPFSEEMNKTFLREFKIRFLITKDSGCAGGFLEKCQAAKAELTKMVVIKKKTEKKQDYFAVFNKDYKTMTMAECLDFIGVAEKLTICDNDEINQDLTNSESGHHPVILKKETELICDDKNACDSCVYIIGMGPGHTDYLSLKAQKIILSSDVIIGSSRMIRDAKTLFCEKDISKIVFYNFYKREEIIACLQNNRDKKAAVLFSGSTKFSSGAIGLANQLSDLNIMSEEIDGMPSLDYLRDKTNLSGKQFKYISCHGRNCDDKILSRMIFDSEGVGILPYGRQQLTNLAGLLKKTKALIFVFIGQRLSYPDEKIDKFSLDEILLDEFDYDMALTAAFFVNESFGKSNETSAPTIREDNMRIKDSMFIRGNYENGKIIPMTKEEVRTLALSKLDLNEKSRLWDIGSGSGSVSCQAGLTIKEGFITAFEREKSACELTSKNLEAFSILNSEVIHATAPEGILEYIERDDEINIPDSVFIGGTGGNLIEIIRACRSVSDKIRFVITAVSVETVGRMEEVVRLFPEYEDYEMIQVGISRAVKASSNHIMRAENPVYIIAFGNKG